MPDHRIPKQTLFGWLPESRPQGGPRRRWRDLIRRDLKTIEVEEELWYSEATTSRAGWRATYQLAMEDEAVKQHQRPKLVTPDDRRQVKCGVCRRSFRRESVNLRPGTNVKVSERSQLASREVQYSVRDVRDGSRASVALQCTDATIRMMDTVTLCSPLVGVRDCVTAASEKEGREVCVIKWDLMSEALV